MACSFKAIHNKEKRTNKSGLYSIYIRVTLHRQTKYFKLDHKVEDIYWSGKNGAWVKPNHPFAFQMNALIQNRISDFQQFELKQHLFNNPVTLDILEKYFKKKGNKNLFNDYAKEFVAGIKGKKLNTLKLYRSFLIHLDNFNPSIPFNQLHENLFHQFAKWLNKEKGLAGITVHTYFKPFRMACRQAVKDGIIEKDPFYGVKISDVVKPYKSKNRVYLELEEITQLKTAKAKIPEGRDDLHEALKQWLFCFSAGFYYSDLRDLKWSNVKNSDLGYCLVGERFKNKEKYVVPIHKFPAAVKIIEGQKGKDAELVFPEAISDQKYNDKLKELAQIADIKKNLMNKTARHSNAQFWVSQGLGREHVAKMLGHSSDITTQTYFELSSMDVNAQVGKFDFSSLDI